MKAELADETAQAPVPSQPSAHGKVTPEAGGWPWLTSER
jgi:hypothetical protein